MSKLKSFAEFLKQETAKKYGVVFLMLLVFSFLCEIFVFNYKWISSVGSENVRVEEMSATGIKDDGTISGSSASITINDINKEVKYLGIILDNENDRTDILNVTISAYDSANSSSMLSAPERTVTSAARTSQYIPLNFSGEIGSMNIKIEKESNVGVKIEDVILNAKVPLIISWPRIFIFALILMAIYALRPRSCAYKLITDLHSTNQQISVALVIIIMSVIFGGMIKWNSGITDWHKTYEHHQMYYELTDAFKSGHLYLEDEPSEELKNMENPYDYAARYAENVQFKWDHAYFDGKYYVYFGALPVILMYLPYNLITGNDLPNYMAVYILGVLLIIGVMFLLWEMIRKWFKKTPFALYIMMSVVFSAAPALTYAAYKPDFYLVPVLMALVLAVFGIAFWLSAEGSTKKGKEILIPWRMCVGSLCVALTAACRPQFLIAAVFGVMLFWNRAFKTRELFSKKSIRETVAVCVPFVVVGILVMIYNAARFGSPFDFGANYNLTTNDMTQRGFVWGRTGLGIFTYLLQPVRIDALFPFLHDFDKATAYQGLTLTEKLMGGVIWLYPILLTGIYGIFRKDLFEDKRAHRMIWFGMIMTLMITIADTQMAGLLTRYYMDFVWLMMMASVITVFALYNRAVTTSNSTANIINVTGLLTAATIAMAFLSIFAHTEDAIVSTNPELYYGIEHMIAFWL